MVPRTLDRELVIGVDIAGITAGDPNRNPTFTLFADADYFLTDFPA